MNIKIIFTTTDSHKTANDIAEHLVNEKLSPCVQIIPKIQSFYEWKDNLIKTDELLVLIKTMPKNAYNCKKLILKYHNYDVPELIETEGKILNDEYRSWFLK